MAKPPPKPRLAHPLCGADPVTLTELIGRARGLHGGGRLRLALAMLAAIGRTPVMVIEAATVGRGWRTWRPNEAPIFIVGHWRSGTTHLYNVMSRSPRFAYVPPIATGLPWDFATLERLLGPALRKTLPADRYIDRIPVHADSPQEDEIALANMQPLSFYHGLYSPERFDREFDRGIFLRGVTDAEIERWRRAVRRFYAKLERTQGGRRLLIKNPVYTARVAELARLFPGAKFIHIHRDPARVFPSMRNFYEVLFGQLGLGPADHVDIDETVLRAYPPMMAALYRDAESLAADQIVHVPFARFEADPLGEIERIHAALGIDGFDEGRPAMAAYLETVRSYKKNAYAHDPELEALLRPRWGEWIDRLGYGKPAPRPAEASAAG